MVVFINYEENTNQNYNYQLLSIIISSRGSWLPALQTNQADFANEETNSQHNRHGPPTDFSSFHSTGIRV